MKFAVCVTPVMDISSPVDFAALVTGRGSVLRVESPNLTWIMNPADDAAAWAATALQRPGEETLAVYVGPPDGEATLREALAIGAEQAVRLELEGAQTPSAQGVAEALSGFFTANPVDWLFCGQATLDWGGASVGPTVAELLDWPLVDHVLEVTRAEDGALRCLRMVSKGEREEVALTAPAVIAISPLAYRPRLAPVPRKLRARRAAIAVHSAPAQGRLPKPTLVEAKRPVPRPKDALPADFSALSATDRLAMMMQTLQPTARSTTTWAAGSPADIARQILDFIEAAGHDWQADRRP